jgi:hypothetical protein
VLKQTERLSITSIIFCYILSTLILQNIDMTRTTLCIKDQYGNCVSYLCRVNTSLGLLFTQYMSSKGIPPIGGLFLLKERGLGMMRCPKAWGLLVKCHYLCQCIAIFLTPMIWIIRTTFLWPSKEIGGLAQNLSNFQMAPIPILRVLTCSTSSPHDILKVSRKIIDHNLPVGRDKRDN